MEVKESKEITERQRNETFLKNKYGTVFVIEVEKSENDIVVGYFKSPDREMLGYLIENFEKEPVKASETMMRTCLVEYSDKRIVEDDTVFISAIQQLPKIIELKKSNLRKL